MAREKTNGSKDRRPSISGSVAGSISGSRRFKPRTRNELVSQVLSDPSRSKNNMLKGTQSTIGNGGVLSNKPLAVVLDEFGVDVTPIPLISPNVFNRGGRNVAGDGSGDKVFAWLFFIKRHRFKKFYRL
jgi:hypothetical protein